MLEVLLRMGGYMAGVSKGWSEIKEGLEVCSSIKCNMKESYVQCRAMQVHCSVLQYSVGTVQCTVKCS